MSQILFDTNVLLDIATADPTWLAWSEGQFRAAAAQGVILINPIIYAELAPAFATQSDLDRWLAPPFFSDSRCLMSQGGSRHKRLCNIGAQAARRVRRCPTFISARTPKSKG
jgi:hypothetical protein